MNANQRVLGVGDMYNDYVNYFKRPFEFLFYVHRCLYEPICPLDANVFGFRLHDVRLNVHVYTQYVPHYIAHT